MGAWGPFRGSHIEYQWHKDECINRICPWGYDKKERKGEQQQRMEPVYMEAQVLT